MRIARLTVVYADGTSEKTARHLTDEIATEALTFPSVDAVKCDVAEFDKGEIDAFWQEATGE